MGNENVEIRDKKLMKSGEKHIILLFCYNVDEKPRNLTRVYIN